MALDPKHKDEITKAVVEIFAAHEIFAKTADLFKAVHAICNLIESEKQDSYEHGMGEGSETAFDAWLSMLSSYDGIDAEAKKEMIARMINEA